MLKFRDRAPLTSFLLSFFFRKNQAPYNIASILHDCITVIRFGFEHLIVHFYGVQEVARVYKRNKILSVRHLPLWKQKISCEFIL